MNKHQYICAICDVVASKSDCFKRKVGAVFVNEDYEILATGYNAPPRQFEHCNQVTNPTHKHTCGKPCTRNIHSEINAIIQSAKRGTALRGSILYVSYTPCTDCMRALINLDIKEIRIKEKDKDETGLNLLINSEIPYTIGEWE